MRESGSRSWGAPGLILLILILGGTGFDLFGLPENAVLAALSMAGFLWLGYSSYRPDPTQSSTIPKKRPTRFFIGSILILALLSLYLFNPSHRWEEGVGALPVNHIGFLPASAFPRGTLHTLLFVATSLVVLGLSMNLGRKEIAGLSTVVLFAAAVTALAVLGQRLTPRRFAVFETTGFFVYENHFAAFANLVLPVALFSAASRRIRAFQEGRVSSPAGLIAFAAILLAAAVMISRSRAGLVITGWIVAAFIFQQIRLRRRDPLIAPPASRLAKAGFGSFAAIAVGAVLFGVAREWHGLNRIGEEISFRFQILSDTLSIGCDHPCWGSGPGSFAAVFPYYQTLPVETYFFSHAHCEPVEFLAEYGLLGGGFLLAACLWIVFPKIPTLKSHISNFNSERAGLWLALLGIGLHSWVDFPLRHPLNILLTVVWIGILAGNKNKRFPV